MEIKQILDLNRVAQVEGPPLAGFFRPGKVLMEAKKEKNLTPAIFDLLSDPRIRRGDGVLYDQARKDYLAKIECLVTKSRPLELVFLGFPFKCHNPIETVRRTPDLGELAFLLRLLD